MIFLLFKNLDSVFIQHMLSVFKGDNLSALLSEIVIAFERSQISTSDRDKQYPFLFLLFWLRTFKWFV